MRENHRAQNMIFCGIANKRARLRMIAKTGTREFAPRTILQIRDDRHLLARLVRLQPICLYAYEWKRKEKEQRALFTLK